MKKKILFQVDTDERPSAFDSVVAIDSGIDQVLPYADLNREQLTSVIHGAMFTRGPDDLKATAIFFGGSDVGAAKEAFRHAQSCFFGPLRVSLMCDPNGSNTTAVAAVLSATRHLDLQNQSVVVLGGTGPVGRRIAELCLNLGANVRVSSRNVERASDLCKELSRKTGRPDCQPLAWNGADGALSDAPSASVVFAAGAAGVSLASRKAVDEATSLKIAIDVNAVPPAGIETVDAMDRGREESRRIFYGAIGVGGLKMKIHKRCLKKLFESNDQLLDLNEIYRVGATLAGE